MSDLNVIPLEIDDTVKNKIFITVEGKEIQYNYTDFDLTFESTEEEIMNKMVPVIQEEMSIDISDTYKVRKTTNNENIFIFPSSENLNKMREIAEEIITFKFSKKDTLSKCLNKFYDIMRKHGIKHGTPEYDDKGKVIGRQIANYEWSMCIELFMTRLCDFFYFEHVFGKVPKDLKY